MYCSSRGDRNIYLFPLLLESDANATLSVILAALELHDTGDSADATERAAFVLSGLIMTEVVEEVGDDEVDAVERSSETSPHTTSVSRSPAPCEAGQREVVQGTTVGRKRDAKHLCAGRERVSEGCPSQRSRGQGRGFLHKWRPPPQTTMCTSKVLSADDILEEASVGKFRSYQKHPVLLPIRTMPDRNIFHLLLAILMLTDPTHVSTCKTEWKLSPDGKSLDVLINTQLNPTLEQVMLPLHDEHAWHWLLMAVNLQRRQFTVYDSLPPNRPDHQHKRTALVTRAVHPSIMSVLPVPRHDKVAVSAPLMTVDTYTNIVGWPVLNLSCPTQTNGYDCGVFVMRFMDVLALQEDTLCFLQDDIRALRDKCLTDLLLSRIRNFPPPLDAWVQ
ncbi:hypothetical protein Cgig2_019276 [Carnegiea gigantea]|uniref:Ubiquitin-like protease family profile domain-containing protein n=1 Tax=Carnegiea gigantea TaxID=171969 RepID=A0A9Q1QKV1_9CARY|nr:hypothetical protein Cgig2_019276 [Carnegiea gigantea]